MKFLLLFLLMFAIYTQTHAQTGKKDELVKTMTDSMKVQLNLDDAQYQKMYDINLSFSTKAQELKNSGGGKLQKLNKMKSIDKERDAAAKKVLTDVQYDLYLEHKKENREKAKERMQERKS